jgi:hypothetical protein
VDDAAAAATTTGSNEADGHVAIVSSAPSSGHQALVLHEGRGGQDDHAARAAAVAGADEADRVRGVGMDPAGIRDALEGQHREAPAPQSAGAEDAARAASPACTRSDVEQHAGLGLD